MMVVQRVIKGVVLLSTHCGHPQMRRRQTPMHRYSAPALPMIDPPCSDLYHGSETELIRVVPPRELGKAKEPRAGCGRDIVAEFHLQTSPGHQWPNFT